MQTTRPLADLHLHLYGCLQADDVFDMLLKQPTVALSRYERTFEEAFGVPSLARNLLDRHRRGDRNARMAFRALFTFGNEDAGNFRRFQAKFDLIIAASCFGAAYLSQDNWPAALAELSHVARSVLDEQVRQGLVHAEQRFFFGMAAPIDFVEAATELLLSIYAHESRIEARLALSLPREAPFYLWDVVTRASLGPFGHVLSGIDFCFFEEGFPPKHQREIFSAVAHHRERHPQRALSILYHVGESFTDKSLESAVRWVEEAARMGAHRLGHAIALGIDPEAYGVHQRKESAAERQDQIRYDLQHADKLDQIGVRVNREALAQELRMLDGYPRDQAIAQHYDTKRLHEVRLRQDLAMATIRQLGTVIETCPTSNLRIGGIQDPAHHPVRRFLAAGLNVVVASDDPGLFDTRLVNELDWVGQTCSLVPEEVDLLAHAALDARSHLLTERLG